MKKVLPSIIFCTSLLITIIANADTKPTKWTELPNGVLPPGTPISFAQTENQSTHVITDYVLIINNKAKYQLWAFSNNNLTQGAWKQIDFPDENTQILSIQGNACQGLTAEGEVGADEKVWFYRPDAATKWVTASSQSSTPDRELDLTRPYYRSLTTDASGETTYAFGELHLGSERLFTMNLLRSSCHAPVAPQKYSASYENFNVLKQGQITESTIIPNNNNDVYILNEDVSHYPLHFPDNLMYNTSATKFSTFNLPDDVSAVTGALDPAGRIVLITKADASNHDQTRVYQFIDDKKTKKQYWYRMWSDPNTPSDQSIPLFNDNANIAMTKNDYVYIGYSTEDLLSNQRRTVIGEYDARDEYPQLDLIKVPSQIVYGYYLRRMWTDGTNKVFFYFAATANADVSDQGVWEYDRLAAAGQRWKFIHQAPLAIMPEAKSVLINKDSSVTHYDDMIEKIFHARKVVGYQLVRVSDVVVHPPRK